MSSTRSDDDEGAEGESTVDSQQEYDAIALAQSLRVVPPWASSTYKMMTKRLKKQRNFVSWLTQGGALYPTVGRTNRGWGILGGSERSREDVRFP